MLVLNPFFLYLKCLFDFILGKKSAAGISFQNIISNHSYRYEADQQKSLKASLRYYVLALKKIFSGKTPPAFGKETLGFDNNYGFYIQTQKGESELVEYIESVSHKTINKIYYRDFQGGVLNLLQKLFLVVFVSLHALVVTIALPFLKKRTNVALNILELVEISILLVSLKKDKISYLFYTSAYEKDANFCAHTLMRNGIKIHKIPSANPISNFYSDLVSDLFSFTLPLQKEEYEHQFKNRWFVNEFLDWPIPNYLSLNKFIISEDRKPQKNTIGFLSRGIWYRRERGDSFTGKGEDLSEDELLLQLKNILQRNPQIKLVIMLHPIEKNKNVITKAFQFYTNFFAPIPITFADASKNSYESYSLCDLSIVSISSANMERLYCGYKALFAPLKMTVLYYENCSIDNICIRKSELFESKVLSSLEMTEKDFFEKNHILDYRFANNGSK